MKLFDIGPFALPNCEPGEVRFEALRDIARVEVAFRGKPPAKLSLSYLRRYWPERRVEQGDPTHPAAFGWIPTDDWFNGAWQRAAAIVTRTGANSLAITFKPLTSEFPDQKDDAVTFRRTMGVKLEFPDSAEVRRIAVFTTARPARSRLRVQLDCGRRTPGKALVFEAYNAVVGSIGELKGVSLRSGVLQLGKAKNRSFELTVAHMTPAHPYANDDGHVTFALDGDAFTISLASMAREGPIWLAEQGAFITRADVSTSFAEYRARVKHDKTITERVLERPEQSYGGAYFGQPRPHPIGYCVGSAHARQIFRIEPNGDLVLDKWMLTWTPGRDTPRYRNKGGARFFFGLERDCVMGRFNDPAPVPVYNVHLRRGDLLVEQKALAVPMERSILDGEPTADETIVALVRFRFRNAGDQPLVAMLPIGYSSDSGRSANALHSRGADDYLVPLSPRDKLATADGRITSIWEGEPVLRCSYETTMSPKSHGNGLHFSQELQPGESCELLLKIPYIAIDRDAELSALDGLDFNHCLDAVTRYWRDAGAKGAQLHTPEPNLDALHAAHFTHVQIADPAMPDGSGLVNTSVGTATYGNFSNESCMIIQELDQRGCHDEARRRLDLFVKYQGTVKLPGNFTDWEGVYYGAGGFEMGNYNQHHGWVLWCLCEHYFLTGDSAWFKRVARSVIAGADWVFRQRRNTLGALPRSRGWERGFLPAGSLEDVTDYWYWLSTNVLTWRGTDAAARALEDAGHSEAARVREESDAYRADLIRGFETARRYAPLVRLRNGRWVPHYPSRLYCRGRDIGWIRETLEGAIYLLISGLYATDSPQAQWILDDYQDNRYESPPFGYQVPPPAENWYDHGGMSIQPNLLAGLMPYLDRDEPEMYLWMFFNAWCACYREETNSMVEHPMPILGYSNSAYVKTSDEANAVMWLRYLLVYATPNLLHFGRALPREWLSGCAPVEARNVATYFGKVSVSYRSAVSDGRIVAELDLALRRTPKRTLVRFRHPAKLPIRSVRVNGSDSSSFDAAKGDVEITGLSGKVTVEAIHR